MNKRITREDGSITLFVLLVCLFFAFMLSGLYINNINRLQAQEVQINQIKENYARELENKEEIYQELTGN